MRSYPDSLVDQKFASPQIKGRPLSIYDGSGIEAGGLRSAAWFDRTLNKEHERFTGTSDFKMCIFKLI